MGKRLRWTRTACSVSDGTKLMLGFVCTFAFGMWMGAALALTGYFHRPDNGDPDE